MDFFSYTTMRDWARRAVQDRFADDLDGFYGRVFPDAARVHSGQLLGQGKNERDWERLRRPYYNVWPAIVPMLTRLDLDLDSSLIQIPLPTLCIRFPKDVEKNPLKFDWKGAAVPIRCILMGYINGETGISLLIDIGETMYGNAPICSYRNFPRRPGLTVEESLAGLKMDCFAEIGIDAVNLRGRSLKKLRLHALGEAKHIDDANHTRLGRLHRIELVVYGRRGAGEIIDFVDLDIERESHVMAQQFEAALVE